jgi:pimeloyl-ACP methyl ester carboxylesterase
MKSASRVIVALLLGAIILLAVLFSVSSYRQETETMSPEVQQSAPGKFITLSGGRVHYKLEGNAAGPLVVLIHGGGITGMEVWSRNLNELLKNRCQVLAYDLYDRGYSDRTGLENTPQLFQSQLTELLDSLALNDRPMVLAGMSMGGMIALDYAVAHPDLVTRLVLIDPALTGDFKLNPLLKVPILSNLLMTLYWYPRALENQEKEFVDKGVFKEYAPRLAYFMNFEGYKKTNYSTWTHMLTQNRLHLLESLPRAMPVLLLYGDRDPYFPKANVPLYQSRFPSIQVEPIEEAGHMPHFERPEDVNPVLAAFLRDED